MLVAAAGIEGLQAGLMSTWVTAWPSPKRAQQFNGLAARSIWAAFDE